MLNRETYYFFCSVRGVLSFFWIFSFLLFSLGCVERRLSFRLQTDFKPYDLMEDKEIDLYLDGEPVGQVPSELTFEHYGTREWSARAPGYQVASGQVTLDAPWYQYPPFDFVTEFLIPFTFYDQHSVAIELEPLQEKSPEEVYQSAKELRKAAQEDLKKARKKASSKE